MASTLDDTESTPLGDSESSSISVANASMKRKREEDHLARDEQSAASLLRIQQFQGDLLHLLESHDTAPSFLKHTFNHGAASKTEPSHKKARLSTSGVENESIAVKLRNRAYTTLQEIKSDASVVSEEVHSDIRAKAKDHEGINQGRLTVEELKAIHKIHAMEALVKDLLDKEIALEADRQHETVQLKEEDQQPNGQVSVAREDGPGRTGTVLTLFGNAPTPKQLFSSMQNPRAAHPAIKTELPVEEMSLPNGITATKVVPVPTDQVKKGPTLEEAFPPPYSLAPLNPPVPHKRPSTRDTAVNWEFKDPIQRNKRGGYTVQPLTVGSWLSYGGIDSGAVTTSVHEKRKQRDRALSTGEGSEQGSSQVFSEEALAREEEALFRRAYSTFAPTRDNSNSMISNETKNMVWWHKVGRKRFNETFALDPALVDAHALERIPDMTAAAPPAPKDEDFSTVLQELDELNEIDPELEDSKSKTDHEQVLFDISQLLETLASYQRIRNISLPSASSTTRAPTSPGPALSTKFSLPDSPTEDEVAVYESLKRELAYLILKLPPYALAKLDGDQLSALGVSTIITTETQDRKGIMEEDQVSRSAKLAAMATANSIASLTRPNSSAGQHYNTTAQRTPAIGQAAMTRYGQSQFGSRTPASISSFQRSNTTQHNYGTPTGASTRPAYAQQNQYNRPGTTQSSYGQTNGQQYFQRQPQANGYGGYGQQYSQASQGQRSSYSTQASMQYQHRSQAAAQNAVGYQTNPSMQSNAYNQNQNASPVKSTGYGGSGQPTPVQQASAFSRPGYQQQPPSSGRETPNSYPSQSNTPVNGFAASRPPAPVAPRPNSTTPQPSQTPVPPPSATQSAQTNGTS